MLLVVCESTDDILVLLVRCNSSYEKDVCNTVGKLSHHSFVRLLLIVIKRNDYRDNVDKILFVSHLNKVILAEL